MKRNRSMIDVRADDAEVWEAVTTSSRDDLWSALLTVTSCQLTHKVWMLAARKVWVDVGPEVSPAMGCHQRRALDEFFLKLNDNL